MQGSGHQILFRNPRPVGHGNGLGQGEARRRRLRGKRPVEACGVECVPQAGKILWIEIVSLGGPEKEYRGLIPHT